VNKLKSRHVDLKFEDWHTHNKLCHHADGSIEDYIKKAIKIKLQTIGVSDHFPYEFVKNIERIPFEDYAITLPEVENYLSITEKLREKYKEDINIRIGFEVDFFKNQVFALNEHLNRVKNRLDYIIGSIHILDLQDGRGAWGFDDSRFRDDYELYGSDKVYMSYYQKLLKMLTFKGFDFNIIGHFDLPKKFNDHPQNKEIISNEISHLLDVIKNKDVIVEINTGGLRKPCKEQYPNKEIIKQMYNLDIPVLLGSDAHNPKHLAWKFKKIIRLLKKIGYNHVAHLIARERTYVEI